MNLLDHKIIAIRENWANNYPERDTERGTNTNKTFLYWFDDLFTERFQLPRSRNLS